MPVLNSPPMDQKVPNTGRQARKMIEAELHRSSLPAQQNIPQAMSRRAFSRSDDADHQTQMPLAKFGGKLPPSTSLSRRQAYPEASLRPAPHIFLSPQLTVSESFYCRCDDPTKHWEYHVIGDEVAASVVHGMLDSRGKEYVKVLEPGQMTMEWQRNN
ncbi:hypothetical protein P280DRAFT_485580 [Massarina eburnea CBS 473.64]|uniref:Uncharacterized protein n=1 Tax=Massarina eburnea CBS 473.64 TaxID=1395130 RepID=A0A6A6RJM2_9PLEO|nr:hypothetical protein P280DRAFT_485580 [Massarina eburnea CBS 473.64]